MWGGHSATWHTSRKEGAGCYNSPGGPWSGLGRLEESHLGDPGGWVSGGGVLGESGEVSNSKQRKGLSGQGEGLAPGPGARASSSGEVGAFLRRGRWRRRPSRGQGIQRNYQERSRWLLMGLGKMGGNLAAGFQAPSY